jgi:hypothetical protein
MFRTGFLVSHQESSTVYTATGVCHTGYADCLLAGPGCSKNKFEKVVHLVGFITRIYHDARSSECQSRSRVVDAAIGYGLGGSGFESR